MQTVNFSFNTGFKELMGNISLLSFSYLFPFGWGGWGSFRFYSRLNEMFYWKEILSVYFIFPNFIQNFFH